MAIPVGWSNWSDDEKYEYTIAFIQERMDTAKANAKSRAKPECRKTPLTNKSGKITKPATVPCGSGCRQPKNCKVTKGELRTIRRRMKGASKQELAEAVKAAIAAKKSGKSSTGAVYGATKGALGQQGRQRLEAKKQKAKSRGKGVRGKGAGNGGASATQPVDTTVGEALLRPVLDEHGLNRGGKKRGGKEAVAAAAMLQTLMDKARKGELTRDEVVAGAFAVAEQLKLPQVVDNGKGGRKANPAWADVTDEVADILTNLGMSDEDRAERRRKSHEQDRREYEAIRRKKREERQAKRSPAILKEIPKETPENKADFVDPEPEKWTYTGEENLEIDHNGQTLAVDPSWPQFYKGERYWQVIPKGGKGKPETHFWAREDQLRLRTDRAKALRKAPKAKFTKGKVDLDLGYGKEPFSVEVESVGDIHVAPTLGNKTAIAFRGMAQVDFNSKATAKAVASRLSQLIADNPELQQYLKTSRSQGDTDKAVYWDLLAALSQAQIDSWSEFGKSERFNLDRIKDDLASFSRQADRLRQSQATKADSLLGEGYFGLNPNPFNKPLWRAMGIA